MPLWSRIWACGTVLALLCLLGLVHTDTQSNKFQCKSGKQTVFQTQVCDYTVDCIGDASDEINCGNCDFENGDCGYKDTSGESAVEWNVTLASDAALKKANAPVDHTSASKSGHYAWTETSFGIGGLRWAYMRSPLIQYASSTCHLIFWIYKSPGRVFSGDQSPDVNIHVKTSGGNMDFTVYESRTVRDKIWTKAVAYVGRVSPPFNFEFDTDVLSKEGFVAVDDIKLSLCEVQLASPPCRDTQFACASQNGCISKNRVCDFTVDCDDSSDELDCAMSYLSCDFESSTCFWKNMNHSEWKRASGSLAGPRRDHTLGTPQGRFLRANYLWGSVASQKLGGLVFLPSKTCTMRFYYYLLNVAGTKGTELKVSTRQYTNGEEKVYVKRNRNAGEYFFREEVTFNESARFEVLFDAYIGYMFDGVALDDISFGENCHLDPNPLPVGPTPEPDFCTEDQFQCKSSKTGPCIKLSQVCDFNIDCPDKSDERDCGACSFENGPCGWDDSSAGMYRWDHRQGKDFVSTKGNIPIEDHTTLSTAGWFLLLTKNAADDSFATPSFLESPVYGPTAPSCTLSFWYHASGSAGALKLSLQTRDRSAVKSIAILQHNGHSMWRNFAVVLGKMEAGHQLVFEARVNEYEEARSALAIAIDDVTFSDCSLKDSISGATYHDISCTFEEGLCLWYQDIANDDFNWKVGHGAILTPSTGPEADHTTGRVQQRYHLRKCGNAGFPNHACD